ncbi:uncharacterized protein B0H64DRAFT_10785 [Chaetomium fimeti]|uniref:Secreted protein n=1 Tax=Chaetomium fimeti TaxID=1854472 RepID=A0AAE0HR51_9PEZI|nr:hypothetical protein B0H64DRAFT_10785 [Chaetomium fimeti]
MRLSHLSLVLFGIWKQFLLLTQYSQHMIRFTSPPRQSSLGIGPGWAELAWQGRDHPTSSPLSRCFKSRNRLVSHPLEAASHGCVTLERKVTGGWPLRRSDRHWEPIGRSN